MGRRRGQRYFGEVCIYCGGGVSAETIDHMPPISLFRGRQRPKGLEFPACLACNSGSRISELVASALVRSGQEPSDAADLEEFKRSLTGVANNYLDLLHELRPSRRQKRVAERFWGEAGASAFNIGLHVNAAIKSFGAKLGFALHAEVSRRELGESRVIPPEGGVAVAWYSNHDAFIGNLPGIIFKHLGEDCTLRQGKMSVEDQFSFSYGIIPGGFASVHFSGFRQSFGVLTIITENCTEVLCNHVDELYRPGFLRDPEKIPDIDRPIPGVHGSFSFTWHL